MVRIITLYVCYIVRVGTPCACFMVRVDTPYVCYMVRIITLYVCYIVRVGTPHELGVSASVNTNNHKKKYAHFNDLNSPC